MADDLLAKSKELECQIISDRKQLLEEHRSIFKELKALKGSDLSAQRKQIKKKELVERLELVMLEVSGLEQISKASNSKAVETIINKEDNNKDKEDWLDYIENSNLAERKFNC